MILVMFNVLTFSKLVGENGSVVALDASEKWIQHINSFKIENIKTICSKVQNANFQENEFDTIFCRYGLWTFKDVVSVLANIRKWLKPGGKFGMITTVFNPRIHYPLIPGKQHEYNTTKYERVRFGIISHDLQRGRLGLFCQDF